MKGLPKNIATRHDIDVLRSYRGTAWDTPESREHIRSLLEAIRATHWQYQFTRVLEDEGDRAGPEPEYRVMTVELEGGGSELHEFALIESAHSRLAQMGVTLGELDGWIAET